MYKDLHSELQKVIKGKSILQEPEPQLQQQPSTIELSIDQLKSMLMAKLLSEGEFSDADLVQRQADVQAQAVSRADFESL